MVPVNGKRPGNPGPSASFESTGCAVVVAQLLFACARTGCVSGRTIAPRRARRHIVVFGVAQRAVAQRRQHVGPDRRTRQRRTLQQLGAVRVVGAVAQRTDQRVVAARRGHLGDDIGAGPRRTLHDVVRIEVVVVLAQRARGRRFVVLGDDLLRASADGVSSASASELASARRDVAM